MSGVIGLGKIGSAVAQIAASFGMNVIANLVVIPKRTTLKSIELVTLDELLGK